ncbi:hypothetical protein ASF48_04935 [Rathayibacter sp. Leaf299]|uniref:IPT/TIG domain-containing protein n=1 Tax=Rathayibacter sp. Leaf299 TaxID=1736328 RepID=UPI0006F9EC76|nr:IPT/TIG domain-containing protein [Rathayibacter sp. Leaf299]KQQ22531.1 hypothetical protein ASF48_04935 [Rathayibacter sp. Leaf299]
MVDRKKLVIPGYGTMFTADRSATFPTNPLSAFGLSGTIPVGWERLGHTSKANTAAFTREGGEAESLGTWLEDNVDTIYSSVAWALGINALQIDKPTLDLSFGGFLDADGGYVIPSMNNGLEKQFFLLMQDNTGKLGFWSENASITGGDAPSIDTANFFEMPLTASIRSADSAKIPATDDGRAGIMKLYKTGLGLPLITAPTPASAAAAATVQITGRNFTFATEVKFGNDVADHVVKSDTRIDAVVPAGASGTANIRITNDSGQSDAFTFARS